MKVCPLTLYLNSKLILYCTVVRALPSTYALSEWHIDIVLWCPPLYLRSQVMPLLHIMHDASHTAIGPNETW